MTKVKLPVNVVSELSAALPHRPPMIWIDQVLTGGYEGGTCRIQPKDQQLYREPNGPFLKYAGIEWVAQAFGYSRALWELEKNPDAKEPARAFLVGIRTSFMHEIPADVGSLIVETKLFRELPPLVLVNGVVRSERTGEEYLKVQLKLFFE